MKRSLPRLVVILALAACGERTQPAPASATPSTARTNATPAPAPAPAPAPEIARARVDALLAAWLGAQNGGRFEEYAALYATRFDGLRRTGEESKRMDREGWLADRRRMFARPMQVAISDVEVVSTAAVAHVRFTQRWSSGTYADEGPKRMLLLADGDALKIGSEEMLASRPLSGVESTIAGGVFSTVTAQRETLVILGQALEGQAQGAPRLAVAESTHVALRSVSATVPAAATALIGQSVHLVSASATCEARIESLAVAAIVVPHFGSVQEWQDEDFDEATTPHPLRPAVIAEHVDEMADKRWLVGIARSTCGTALAATRGTAAPTLLARRDASTALVAEVRGKLLAGPLAAPLFEVMREAVQAAAESEAPVANEAVTEAITGNLTIVEHAREGASVVVARVAIPGECGGSVRTFVFERVGTGLVRRALAASDVDLVFDATGDGTLEAAFESELGIGHGVARLGDRAAPITQWWTTYLDCGC